MKVSEITVFEAARHMKLEQGEYDPAEVESTREFLLSKGKKEPENGKVYFCGLGKIVEIDPDAFIIVQEAHQVLGDGFSRYTKDSL